MRAEKRIGSAMISPVSSIALEVVSVQLIFVTWIFKIMKI